MLTFIVMVITLINIILLISNYQLYKKERICAVSCLLGVKLNTARIRYDSYLSEGKFDKYPNIKNRIAFILNIENNYYVNFSDLVLKKYRILDFKPLADACDLINEFKECNHDEIKELFDQVGEMSARIAQEKFPIRTKVNRLKLHIQLKLIVLLNFIIIKFDNSMNKNDIENIEDNTDELQDLMNTGNSLSY